MSDYLSECASGAWMCEDCVERQGMVTCVDCRLIEHPNRATEVNGDYVCRTCIQEYTLCDDCGEYFSESEDMHFHRDNTYCASCWENVSTDCNNCGRAIYTPDWEDSSDPPRYCEECQENLCSCNSCGRMFLPDPNVDDDSICHRCRAQSIAGYGRNPIIKHFYHAEEEDMGIKPMTLGIEVEMDNGVDKYTVAREIKERYDFFWCTSDASLSDKGFEVPMHPASLRVWQDNNSRDLNGFCRYVVSQGFRAHNTDTCGLHVHVGCVHLDREGATVGLAKIVWLTMNHWPLFRKISRRESPGWAKAYPRDDWNNPDRSFREDRVMARAREDHHMCWAFNNEHRTIECRMPKGTLNPETIRATIEMVVCMVEIATSCTWDRIENITTLELYRYFAQHPNLGKYMARIRVSGG